MFALAVGRRLAEVGAVTGEQKEKHYQAAWEKACAMLDGETGAVAAMATLSSVLAGEFPYFYWTGFYRLVRGELVVGPYQGTPGCLRIALDRGVCGAAASSGKTLVVEDVREFSGHVACDARSMSEIVVPVRNARGELTAVLDVDSTELAAFDRVDQDGLERIVSLLVPLRAAGQGGLG